ncbi:MAG: glycosyltransferase family 4 protein [Methanoregula sp.]|nr:glycosyltransferase family 4 protein [Methanoregula sp.]
MKIAFVSDVIYPYIKGGVEKRVWELAVRLSCRGHDVHLYGMKFWEGDDIIVQDGVTLHGVCPVKDLYVRGRRTIGEAVYFGMHLIRPLAQEKFDIIDCQQFPYMSCFSAKAVAVMKKTPLVITWHEVWGDYWYTYLGITGVFGKFIEWGVSRLISSMVAVSATTTKKLRKLNGKTDVRIIPNGVDLKRMNTILPHDEMYDIIFVGRLIKEKNVDLLVRAMGILSRENKNYQLLIIGEGPERDTIVRLIHECSLEPHVRMIRFRDNHDEIIAHMKSAKICVLPSTREGFGIVALEALACGLPVVTVDHSANAIRDLITERTGFICSLSATDLADNIHSAIEHHAEMKVACITSVASLDWDCIATDMENYYRSVIERQHIQN